MGRVLRGVEGPRGNHPFPVGKEFAKGLGYPSVLLAELPARSVDALTGVSNVSIIAEIPAKSTCPGEADRIWRQYRRLRMLEVRRIYRAECVRIDYWPLPYKVKALYMCDDGDSTVAFQRRLPDEPKIFALVHELKHHYRDRPALGSGLVHCGDYDANELIEKGAEVFAAEFIYPEDEFSNDIEQFQRPDWAAEDVVQFKRNCGVKVSYQFLCKRLEWLAIIKPGQFRGVQFQKLEHRMFGTPFQRKRRAGDRALRY